MVRGTVILPHGTGKTARVIVFATGDARRPRSQPAPTRSVATSSSRRSPAGYTDFDVAVSTPELMGKVGRLGKVLGPRGLMPNPKTGTVTPDMAKAVSDIKGGKIEFRVDKHANVHFVIGKARSPRRSSTRTTPRRSTRSSGSKPSSSKGRYITKGTVSTTFGPGVPVDPNCTKNVADEDES